MKEQLENVLQRYAPNSLQIISDEKTLSVYEVLNGTADQEVYFELEKEGQEFRLSRVSRGQKVNSLLFQNEQAAGLALAVISLKYTSDLKHSRPDLSEHLEGYTDAQAEQELFGEAIDSRHYSLLKEKRRAVVLDKGEDLYDVVYIDQRGEKGYISEDFETFGDALVVVYNYAWYLELLAKLNQDWTPALDTESEDYENIAKLLLTIM